MVISSYAKMIKSVLRPYVIKYVNHRRLKSVEETKRIIKRITSEMDFQKNSVFIDCGSNLGQGFGFFSQYFTSDKFDYYLIEPNPHCEEKLMKIIDEKKEKCSIKLIKKAVSTENGFIDMLIDKSDNTSEGASILRGYNLRVKLQKPKSSIKVEKFSFSDFLKEQAIKYDNIIVKMDIEGGEYDVIEKLICSGSHMAMSLLIVEFHSQFMANPQRRAYKKRQRRIIRRLKRDSVPTAIWI